MVTQPNNPAKRKQFDESCVYRPSEVKGLQLQYLAHSKCSMNTEYLKKHEKNNHQGIYDLKSQDYYMFISKNVYGVPIKYQEHSWC